MKLKEIEVGAEYAIGAPNSTYDQWSRIRGRILRVGVRGGVRTDWGAGSLSQNASYVEFEPIDCIVPWTYTVTVVDDPRVPAGERLAEYRRKGDEARSRESHRCLATHVLMPWAEYEPLRTEHLLQEEEKEQHREHQIARCRQFASEFEKILGPSNYCDNGGKLIKLTLDQAEELLGKIYELSKQKAHWEAATHATQQRLDEALANEG